MLRVAAKLDRFILFFERFRDFYTKKGFITIKRSFDANPWTDKWNDNNEKPEETWKPAKPRITDVPNALDARGWAEFDQLGSKVLESSHFKLSLLEIDS